MNPTYTNKWKAMLLSAAFIGMLANYGVVNGQFNATLGLSEINGSNGFLIKGISDGGDTNQGDGAGTLVSGVGDINGDGLYDLIIGQLAYSVSQHSCYVVFGSDGALPHPFMLSSLNGTNGFIVNRASELHTSATAIAAAGDINGDDIDDVVIAVASAKSVYLVYGTDQGFSNPFELSSLNGSNGIVIVATNPLDGTPSSVGSAGDVNGDGIDDLLIGAPNAYPNPEPEGPEDETAFGASYLVFGSDQGLPNPLDLSTLNGTNGIVIKGVNATDFSGTSVSAAGDINGDDIDDVIIGARPWSYLNQTAKGLSFVVFGSNQGLSHPFELSTLNGTNGLTINGARAGDLAGKQVSKAGDINGDGIDDLLIGSTNGGIRQNPFDNSGDVLGEGFSYVVFGSNESYPNPLNLINTNSLNGFWSVGVEDTEFSGTSISDAGDINGDGIDDLVIGSPDAGDFSGTSYVVFGSKVNVGNPFRLVNLDGSNGFAIKGVDVLPPGGELYSGLSVSSVGDFNGDGVDDLIIGAKPTLLPNNWVTEGASYVIFGRGPVVYKDGFESLVEE